MDDAAPAPREVYSDMYDDPTTRRREKVKVTRAIAGMESGAGDFSYTRNSLMQSQSINILKPILEQEIMELELLEDRSGSAILMADFGCSGAANTLGHAEICSRNVCRARLSGGRKFLDEDWRKTLTIMEDFYVTAGAGSFHRRFFLSGV